jgi:hypothetical protein
VHTRNRRQVSPNCGRFLRLVHTLVHVCANCISRRRQRAFAVLKTELREGSPVGKPGPQLFVRGVGLGGAATVLATRTGPIELGASKADFSAPSIIALKYYENIVPIGSSISCTNCTSNFATGRYCSCLSDDPIRLPGRYYRLEISGHGPQEYLGVESAF